MDPTAAPERPLHVSLGVFLTVAGVSAGMTLLFLGMRAVMDIGGMCAQGGPYVIRQPCPEGVPLVILGGLWGGIICAGLYAWQCARNGVPSLAGLLWPALFLSLGWNFLEYGLDPPGSGGLVWGWLVCAVLFFLMGGVPLVFVLQGLRRGFAGTASSHPSALLASGLTTVASRFSRRPSPSEEPDDLVSTLAKLDELHRSGALDDAEYETAKDRVLGREDP